MLEGPGSNSRTWDALGERKKMKNLLRGMLELEIKGAMRVCLLGMERKNPGGQVAREGRGDRVRSWYEDKGGKWVGV